MKFFKRRHSEGGQILVTLIIVVPSLILMIAAYLVLSTSNYRLSRTDQFHTMSQAAADSGADFAIAQINQNANYTGTAETVLHSDSTQKTTYTSSVANVDANNKTVTVVGKTYWPASAAAPTTSVTIKVQLRAVAQGSYSLISGQGGLIMGNSAKIIAGDIYINGTISMSNSSQIGLTTNPVNVSVADQACPKTGGASYPQLCAAGDNVPPIVFQNGASGKIYGNTKANNGTADPKLVNPGLTASSGVSAAALPSYDRNAQKSAIQTTLTGAAASCSSGTKTWSANTKINGNVTISNTCKLTIQGNVWITGNLTVANSAQMIVSDSLGPTRPVVMIDGAPAGSGTSKTSALFQQSSKIVSNASGTGAEFISYYSTAPCSPDCLSVTGDDLKNSQSITTLLLMDSASAPQSIFYSFWSQVTMRNSGQIGALVGQTINMAQSGTLTFGSAIQGGNTYWVANGYRRAFP